MADWHPNLAHYDELIQALDPNGPPEVRTVVGNPALGERLAVLPAAFNPPTRAHLGLALAALDSGAFDRLLLMLSVRIIDKEATTGASLDSRLHMLTLVASGQPHVGVALCNRGLYLDQATAIQDALAPRDLAFVVGFDKIIQILDPRYYVNRDDALRSLFRQAHFLVAPRDGADEAMLDELFGRPENREYRSRVAFLPLSAMQAKEQALSSTLVRELLGRGKDAGWAVPPAIAGYLQRANPYQER